MTHTSDTITILDIPTIIDHVVDPVVVGIILGGIVLLLVSTAIWKLNRRLKKLEK